MDQLFIHGIPIQSALCPTCGVVHCFPMVLKDEDDKQTFRRSFHCPNGHTWSYLAKPIGEELRTALQTMRIFERRAEHAQKRADRLQAKLKKLRKGKP